MITVADPLFSGVSSRWRGYIDGYFLMTAEAGSRVIARRFSRHHNDRRSRTRPPRRRLFELLDLSRRRGALITDLSEYLTKTYPENEYEAQIPMPHFSRGPDDADLDGNIGGRRSESISGRKSYL
jgi:hypothetical protein